MKRNKFSYLKGDELVKCRDLLETLPSGHSKDFAEELLRRFEKVCDSSVVRCNAHDGMLRDAVDGKL